MNTSTTQAALESVCATLDRIAQRETDKALAEVGQTCIQNDVEHLTKTFFFEALGDSLHFANITYDTVQTQGMMRRGNVSELFDILLINDTSVAIIETAYRAHQDDLEELTTKKVQNFRTLFPLYAKHKIYLGIASMSFNEEVINEAKKLGIGILKPQGDTLECDTENIKVY